MAEPFIAEVRIFPYNFAPRNWANCDGQLLPIAQNTALFALIGTLYGGDGRTTFGLPNLKGRAVIHPGNGPGLTPYNLAQSGGVEKVTLGVAQMAKHNHDLMADTFTANSGDPNGRALARSQGANAYQTNTTANLVQMSELTLQDKGADQPHNNMLPFLTLRFCIALVGIFPSRS